MCILVCSRHAARSVPKNYILLFNFTAALSIFVAYVAAYSTPKLVLIAAIYTATLTLGLSVYASMANEEITYCGGTGIIFLSAICSFGICYLNFGN